MKINNNSSWWNKSWYTRLWNVNKTDKKLDTDRFRKDLGNLIEAYQDVARRLGIVPEETNISEVNFGKTTSIKFYKKIEILNKSNAKKRCSYPQGKVVKETLQNMGKDTIKNLKQGKYFEIEID